MKQCPKCETRLDDDVKICLNCGYDFEKESIDRLYQIKTSSKGMLRNVILISICVAFLGVTMYRRYERTVRFNEVKEDYFEESQTSTSDEAQEIVHPSDVEWVAPYYQEMVDIAEKYHDGEIIEEDVFRYSIGEAYANMEANIVHDGHEISIQYGFNNGVWKKYIITYQEFARAGVDIGKVEAFCEVVGIQENKVKSIVTHFMEELKDDEKTKEENYPYENGNLKIIFSQSLSLFFEFAE